MTGKEYTLCASDSPSTLACEVTDRLSQGWELYGHPFAGAQNGHPESEPAICQAMVRGVAQPFATRVAMSMGAAVGGVKLAPVARPSETPAIKPRKAQIKTLRTPRPAVAATAGNVAIFLAVMLGGCFIADALIFRSGFYGQFLEPVSYSGNFERIFSAEANRRPSGRKEILVVGNSRLAEGFSAKIANEYKNDGYWFSNCAIMAGSVRTLYYFVRDIDPHRNRYAAIAVPIDDFDDVDGIDDPADDTRDMWLVINRLRLADIVPYTLSFKSWQARFEVLRGSTLKGVVFQRDFLEFMRHVGHRLKSVKDYRQHGSDWMYAYGGSNQSLAGLSVDWAHCKATFPPGMPRDQQSALADAMLHDPPQHGWVHAFRIEWVGALVDLYRGSNTRIIIYQVPRHPVPRPTPLAHWSSSTADEMRKRPWVTVIDRGVFEPLERPELFFDYIHLNAAGRQLFSPLLADTIKASLSSSK